MKKVSKITAAAIIFAVLAAASIPYPVSALSQNERRSVQNFFIEAQLLKGDGSGYGLEKTANRLEGMIILIRLMGKEAEAQEMKGLPCRFTDVPDWATGYVNYAYQENISKGMSDTRFGINDKITALQYNTLLLRILGYDDSRGDFQWDRSVNKAKELSILPADLTQDYLLNGTYTKGDLIETSFCYLEAKFKARKETLISLLTKTGAISDALAEKYGLDIEGWYSVTTGFNKKDYLNFQLSGSDLTIIGTSEDKDRTYLLVLINTVDTGAEKARQIERMGTNNRYDIRLSLSRLAKGEYYVDVYGNDERYNEYTSSVLSSLILKKTEDDLYFEVPPVYGRNVRTYEGNQLNPLDYQMTASTKASQVYIGAISEKAKEITEGISDDYEKAQAIHDWVAEEIYYDKDYLSGKAKQTNIDSIAVLNNKYTVCSGYTNLTNDLLVAAGIPSRQVLGYALGVTEEGPWDKVDLKKEEPNHVWNEAYIDGRWVIIDTTWDSNNTYKDQKFKKGDGPSQLYFDVTLPFLSNKHQTLMPE